MIVSSIDVGTNTVILLVAEVDKNANKIIPLYNEQRIPRIGKNLKDGTEISTAKIKELFQILHDYRIIIDNFKCERNFLTATNALRIASNGKEIIDRIISEFDIEARIVEGDTEAELSFLGATFECDETNDSLVIDIGGGSTEIIHGRGRNIDFKKSTQMGVVSAEEYFLKSSPPPPEEISSLLAELEKLFKEFPVEKLIAENVIAIAGTPTTLAAIKENLTQFDEEKIEGHILYKKDINDLIEEISSLTSEEILKKFKSVVRGREDVILAGTIILYFIMDKLGLEKVKVSTKGIRYGRIVKEMF